MASAIIAVGTAISGAAATAFTSLKALYASGVTGAAAGGASTLSTVLSAGSALAAIGSGFAQQKALKEQAQISRLQEQQTRTQGAQQRAILAREYEELLGEQRAVAGASNLNPGVGSPQTIARATTMTADRNLGISRENTRQRFLAQRSRTRSLLSEGRLARTAGFVRAGQIGLDALELVG